MMGSMKTDQIKVISSAYISSKGVDPRYTVYVAEIRKRLTYITLSLLFALLCAYTQRVALMYSITLSLQKSLPKISQGVQITEFFKGDRHNNNVNQPLSLSVCSQPEGESLLLADKGGESKSYSFQEIHDLFDFSAINQDGAVRLIFTDVEEAFYTLLSVSLFWCVWACFPVLVYHTLCFFQPGFYAGQSRRVCAFVLKRLIWGYLALWLVDLFLIPRLLLFFYSFQIERSSLCLHAETKVVSYVSLYVFVYGSTVALLLLTGLWGSYRRRQILDWLSVSSHSKENSTVSQKTESTSAHTHFWVKGYLTKKLNPLGNQYREQRGKIWWGCLLIAALISPPDISSQFACALLLIVWGEVGIWLAYISSCRASAAACTCTTKGCAPRAQP